jgi:hypothetical protein
MDSNFIDGLKQAGYSNKELNDVLALQLTFQRSTFREDKESKAAAIESAGRLATEMDLQAKLTGKSREEQMENMRKQKDDMQIESSKGMVIDSQTGITIYSKAKVGIKADGTLTLNSNGGSWGAGEALRLKAGGIDLNGPAADVVTTPNPITKTTMDDTSFSSSTGWKVNAGGLESIVSRAPTHEPYPYHNKGVDSTLAFEQGTPSPPPGAVPVPPGVEIQAK